MAIKVYLKDEQGLELPYSGSAMAWFGAWAEGHHGTARTQIEVRQHGQLHMLTTDSFGKRRVRVKVWSPGGSDYFDLVPGPVEQVSWPTQWVHA